MSRMKAILVFVAALAFAIAPFFATSFRGYDPYDFPVLLYDPPIQPAGYAFSIWGLLYVWLLVHAAFGLFAHADEAGWDAPRWPLFLSLVIGAGWLEAAQRAPVLATGMIWVMAAGAAAAALLSPGRKERWFRRAPLATYAGWLTAAAGVATGVVLPRYGLMTGDTAALLCLLLVLALALPMQFFLGRSPGYGLAVIWALIGIAAANSGRPLPVGAAAVAGALVMGALLLHQQRRPRRRGLHF